MKMMVVVSLLAFFLKKHNWTNSFNMSFRFELGIVCTESNVLILLHEERGALISCTLNRSFEFFRIHRIHTTP